MAEVCLSLALMSDFATAVADVDAFRYRLLPIAAFDVGDVSVLLVLLLLLLSLEFLFGFGGNAGRPDMSLVVDSTVERIVCVFMLGATACTRGLGIIDLCVDVIDVGATLLIGFRGGTTKLPDGI